MKSVRERFEEIWPVPFGVYWSDDAGEYMPLDGADHWQYSQFQKVRDSYCARLDTFTRCHETTFSKEELNLFRQWFNAIEDLSPAYLEKSDCNLYRKVMEMMK